MQNIVNLIHFLRYNNNYTNCISLLVNYRNDSQCRYYNIMHDFTKLNLSLRRMLCLRETNCNHLLLMLLFTLKFVCSIIDERLHLTIIAIAYHLYK